jgi:hypothetical protein
LSKKFEFQLAVTSCAVARMHSTFEEKFMDRNFGASMTTKSRTLSQRHEPHLVYEYHSRRIVVLSR